MLTYGSSNNEVYNVNSDIMNGLRHNQDELIQEQYQAGNNKQDFSITLIFLIEIVDTSSSNEHVGILHISIVFHDNLL